MSGGINSGNTTNDQDHLVASEATPEVPVSIDAALLDNVNTRAKAVLEAPLKLTAEQQAVLLDAYREVKKALEALCEFEAKTSLSERTNIRLYNFSSKVETLAADIYHYILAADIYHYIARPNSQHTDVEQRHYQRQLRDLNHIQSSAYARGVKNGFIAGVIKAFLGVVALVTADKTLFELLGGRFDPFEDFDHMTVGRSFKLNTHHKKADRKKVSQEFYALSDALTLFHRLAKNATTPQQQPTPTRKKSL